MKQAQVDANELIAAYRVEQQDAFDKKANADGKSAPSYKKSTHDIIKLPLPLTTFPHHYCHHLNTPLQADLEPTPPPNSKQKPMPKFKTCRDNSIKMPKRLWMFFCRSAAKLAWRFLRQGSVLRKRFTANKLTLPIRIWENVGDRVG